MRRAPAAKRIFGAFRPDIAKKDKAPRNFLPQKGYNCGSRISGFLNGIVSPVKDVVYLALLFAPLAAAGIAAIACACNKKLRARSKNWFLYLSCAFCPFAAAFGVLSYGGAALYAAAPP